MFIDSSNYGKFAKAIAKAMTESRGVARDSITIGSSRTFDEDERELDGLMESETITLSFRNLVPNGREHFWDMVKRYMREMN